MEPQSENKHSLAALIPLSILIAVGVFGAGFYTGNEYNSAAAGDVFGNTDRRADIDMAAFWRTWDAINEKYVPHSTSSMPTETERVYGAAQGLANSLEDPYTVFLPPRDNEIFKEDISGNFEGVGMEIGIRDDTLTVISPLDGTPAARAGLESGDQIIRIDGTSTAGMTVEAAVKQIRGPKGSEVVLTIAREGEGELLEIPVTRDVIRIPTINTTNRPDGVFVIKLHNFSAISPGLFRNALREFMESGSSKLIFDLRGNPGGYLEASVDMASWFLPAGKIVVREYFGEGKEERAHRSKGYNVFNDNLEMVVLVNQGSASASEILAGALQEHGVATLVGEQTFGKGSVQELVDITTDTSFKVTIARWLTPKGNSISQNGLTPDVEVERTREDVEAGRDPQLEKAVEILTN